MLRRLLQGGALALAVTAALLVPSAPALADTGGGCQNSHTYSNPYTCVSVSSGTTNPLRGDAYLNNRYYGETYAYVHVYIQCHSTGAWYHAGGVYWNLNNTHSPVVPLNKPCATNGHGYTYVEYYTPSGYLYPSFSPNQYW
jgi:hypothetical protein